VIWLPDVGFYCLTRCHQPKSTLHSLGTSLFLLDTRSSASQTAMGRSVLDDLGQEVTGIVAPVSICMAITVALVRLLNPEGQSDSNTVYIAQIYYSEDVGRSPVDIYRT
jgi:hypothetical protein